MPTQVRLFISAGPDLEPAREVLGLALAEFPVNVGWVIKRTPDVDSVAESHLFVMLLGADIVAPTGLELWWARRTEKPIFAYQTARLHTPAAQVFLQENADLPWKRCADLHELRRLVLADLTRFLLAHPDRYGVTVPEVQRLQVHLAALEKSARAEPRTEEVVPKPAGASGGGVILAPGKDEPPGARLIGETTPR